MVDGEPFDGRLLECPCESGDRVAIVEVGGVAFVLSHASGDVDTGRFTGAGEGDVAPFFEARVSRCEYECPFDGEALAGVAGERVGVADIV